MMLYNKKPFEKTNFDIVTQKLMMVINLRDYQMRMLQF